MSGRLPANNLSGRANSLKVHSRHVGNGLFAEIPAGITDDQVIDLARSERRLLITEDKDFGQLVFSATKENSGVLLVRFPALADAVLALLNERGNDLYSCFVVLEPGRVRLARLV